MTGRQDRVAVGAAQPARRVLVVGGSPARPAPELLTRLVADADAVVACDSGADACRAAGVRLSALIGDNDSLDPLSLRYARDQGACERGFSPDKDQADLGLALQYVRQAYPHVEEVTLTGVLGGRADHELAVLGTLARAADLRPVIEENEACARVLSASGRSFWAFGPRDVGRTFSAMALLGEATLSEAGMRWELRDAPLAPLSDLGLSNVIERADAHVSVSRGVVFAYLLREVHPKRVTVA